MDEPSYTLRPEVEGFPVQPSHAGDPRRARGEAPIAATIGRRAEGWARQSAGALPGPACFDLGGRHPTVTDANLVLGWLDPECFLGGAKKLDREKARAAIETAVAAPLGVSIEEAAWLIKDTVETEVGPGVGPAAPGYGAPSGTDAGGVRRRRPAPQLRHRSRLRDFQPCGYAIFSSLLGLLFISYGCGASVLSATGYPARRTG